MTNLRQRFRDYGQQLRQAQFHILAQVHAERTAAAVGKDLKIAACLRRFHRSDQPPPLLLREVQTCGVVAGPRLETRDWQPACILPSERARAPALFRI